MLFIGLVNHGWKDMDDTDEVKKKKIQVVLSSEKKKKKNGQLPEDLSFTFELNDCT